MKIYLRDRNEKLVEEWRKVFKDKSEVEISHGDIFDEGPHLDAEAIVSPANSFGFMNGGIDAVYSDYFGFNQNRSVFGGEVVVGSAFAIDLYDPLGPKRSVRNKTCCLICAPTMRIPMNVANTVNAYLAFRIALYCTSIQSILCPGLCTATGGMSPEVCAHQMFCAYIDFNNPRQFRSLRDAVIFHNFLINPG